MYKPVIIPGYKPKNQSGVKTQFGGKWFYADERIAYQQSLTKPGKWMVYGWVTRKSVFFLDTEKEAEELANKINEAQQHSLGSLSRSRVCMEACHA